MLQGKEVEMSNFWSVDDSRPIHLKEASALYCALMAVQDTLKNLRVDACVDNTALVRVWENQGRKDINLNRIVKDQVTYINNIDLRLHYIPSKCNPADAPSRKLTFLDGMLTKKAWDMIQGKFGTHSVDLMSLGSNVMKDEFGKPLKHFTPHPTPFSAGVNVFFSQRLEN